jgi:hypothetical protein
MNHKLFEIRDPIKHIMIEYMDNRTRLNCVLSGIAEFKALYDIIEYERRKREIRRRKRKTGPMGGKPLTRAQLCKRLYG